MPSRAVGRIKPCRPDAEETLTVIAVVGLVFALFIAMTALNSFDWESKKQDWDFYLLAALATLFMLAHAPLKWWAPAVRLAQIAWPVFVVGSVAVLWRTPILVPMIVVFPIAISIKLWLVGDRLAAYRKGILDNADWPPEDMLAGDACRVCGERGCEIVAPQWCFSFVYAAVRQIGRPRRVCPHHARLYALPAVVVSGLVGWWSIWGLFWTPAALMQNVVDGGQILDEASAREWLDKANEGPLGISSKEWGVVLLAFLIAFAAPLLMAGIIAR